MDVYQCLRLYLNTKKVLREEERYLAVHPQSWLLRPAESRRTRRPRVPPSDEGQLPYDVMACVCYCYCYCHTNDTCDAGKNVREGVCDCAC